MSKSKFDIARDDLTPMFNLYAGRDASLYAMYDFEPTLARQEFLDECDVNKIMARFDKTGTLPVYADKAPFYVDAVDLPSFQDMQNVLISANEAFMSLPATVRSKFDNDPIRFADYANDPANVEDLKEWNMLSPDAVQRLDAAKAAEAAKAADRAAAASKAAEASSHASPIGTK